METNLKEKFVGSMLGALLGDVIGAVVEGESPGYIRKTFKNLDELLALEHVEELFGGKWPVGRYTDDTQMALSVAEWLISETVLDGKSLLARFSKAYEPWRRYGPGAGMILEAFPEHQANWSALATMMFPQGSYGNGSAMRVAPIGLYFHRDVSGIIEVARTSSMTTHSHHWAVQGATLQATAVALAASANGELLPNRFVENLELVLSRFDKLGQDTSPYQKAFATMKKGLSVHFAPAQVCDALGVGIKAHEAVPMAIYCFLASPSSYEKAIEQAIFLGGDTDTIACMTGAISGAYLGAGAIPRKWLDRVQEKNYSPQKIRELASKLFEKASLQQFKIVRG
jgi:poly(ADP-ribose) glycohydrolase ARH3